MVRPLMGHGYNTQFLTAQDLKIQRQTYQRHPNVTPRQIKGQLLLPPPRGNSYTALASRIKDGK
jgi:hypothetical protein